MSQRALLVPADHESTVALCKALIKLVPSDQIVVNTSGERRTFEVDVAVAEKLAKDGLDFRVPDLATAAPDAAGAVPEQGKPGRGAQTKAAPVRV